MYMTKTYLFAAWKKEKRICPCRAKIGYCSQERKRGTSKVLIGSYRSAKWRTYSSDKTRHQRRLDTKTTEKVIMMWGSRTVDMSQSPCFYRRLAPAMPHSAKWCERTVCALFWPKMARIHSRFVSTIFETHFEGVEGLSCGLLLAQRQKKISPFKTNPHLRISPCWRLFNAAARLGKIPSRFCRERPRRVATAILELGPPVHSRYYSGRCLTSAAHPYGTANVTNPGPKQFRV